MQITGKWYLSDCECSTLFTIYEENFIFSSLLFVFCNILLEKFVTNEWNFRILFRNFICFASELYILQDLFVLSTCRNWNGNIKIVRIFKKKDKRNISDLQVIFKHVYYRLFCFITVFC